MLIIYNLNQTISKHLKKAQNKVDRLEETEEDASMLTTDLLASVCNKTGSSRTLNPLTRLNQAEDGSDQAGEKTNTFKSQTAESPGERWKSEGAEAFLPRWQATMRPEDGLWHHLPSWRVC